MPNLRRTDRYACYNIGQHCYAYRIGGSVTYTLELSGGPNTSHSQVFSVLGIVSEGHEPVRIRIEVSGSVGDRWAEVTCQCGLSTTRAGKENYMEMVQEAWAEGCGVTRLSTSA